MSSTHNRLKNTVSVITPTEHREDNETASSGSKTANSISETEAAALRSEKVAAIKKAVEAGAYDSEELLEKAMTRMKERIENEDNSQ